MCSSASMDFLELLLQFALGPSDFSVCNVMDEELKEGTSHGVKVLYKFPWGSETLETLWSLGDTLLLKTHQGACTKLQVRANCVCLKCVLLYQINCTNFAFIYQPYVTLAIELQLASTFFVYSPD